jgi:energy-coupling factor transporter transmembrane protein EcfT
MDLAPASSRRRSPVSSLDPVCRLLCLALISSASLFATWRFALFFAVLALALLVIGGLGPWTIARESSFVLAFASLAALMRLFGGGVGAGEPGAIAAESAVYGLRLWAAFLAGRLFYASTRLAELRDAATRLARRLPFLRSRDIGLGLSLILGYIPLVFEEWRDSLEAARSRGMPRRGGLRSQSLFIMAFLRRLMIKAVEIPQSLIARGWSEDRGLAAYAWRKRDSACLALCAACCAAAILRVV